MKRKDKQILALIERFMAGETTVAEEHRLFAAFAAGRRLAPELEPWREQMQWYASLEPAASVPRMPRFVKWVSAAAVAALMVTVSVGYATRHARLQDEMQIYAGSYVIRNGVKNTNIAEILPELKHVESVVSAQQLQAREQAAEPDYSADLVAAGIDLDDPEVKKMIDNAFNMN